MEIESKEGRYKEKKDEICEEREGGKWKIENIGRYEDRKERRICE
jgi:hypothetical protein